MFWPSSVACRMVPGAVARRWAKKPQEGSLLFARSAPKISMRFPDASKLLRDGDIDRSGQPPLKAMRENSSTIF